MKVHMPVSFLFTYACPTAQHYRQRRVWKVSLLAIIWKYGISTLDSGRPQDWLVTVKMWNAITLFFSVVLLHFTERFKQKDSTSAISAVTKSSMKPQSCATANRHLHSNGKQRRTKVSFGRAIMQALELEKAHLGTERRWTVKKSSPSL